jgi:hypothetical protein
MLRMDGRWGRLLYALAKLGAPSEPLGYGNLGIACELEVRSSLGFGALILFVYVEAHLMLPNSPT